MQKISLSLFVLLIPIWLQAQYTVFVGNNYPPYNYVNEQGEPEGFNIDLINAIADLYNIDIEIETGEWCTFDEKITEGEIYAIGGVHYSMITDNDYLYTRSALNTAHCFLYNKNHQPDFSIEVFRSLKQPKVAVWNTDVLVQYVKSINPGAEFVFINNYPELIEALDREDITCLFAQRVNSMYQADITGKDYIRPLSHRILERNMGFQVSKDHPELAKMLNNGLEVLLANGKHRELYDKWLRKYNEDNNKWSTYVRHSLITIGILGILFLMLLVINNYLRRKVRSRTADLEHQLKLNTRIMKELEKEKERAEESERMKSAFLANMSHEIRTPMNGILGFADLLKSPEFDKQEQKQFIEIIQKSGKRMLSTINNIIDISKLEAGAEKLRYKQVDVSSVLGELKEFFSKEAQSRGLELVLENTGPLIQQGFYTDEYKLNSIVTNLVKNAIKFTSEGEVRIAYSVSQSKLELIISDTGPGIDPDKQSMVFEYFAQADYSYSRNFEGSGLGLAITRGYVNILNGDIQLESEPGKGTTFRVSIPNHPMPSGANNAENNVVETKPSIAKKHTYLIAEDDETSFIFLQQILKNSSQKIYRAENGIEAVELMREHPEIEIILMDLKMPLMNGYEAVDEIRQFNKEVYIIAQTAYAQPEDREKAKKSGFNSYISKPVKKEKLLRVINRVVKH